MTALCSHLTIKADQRGISVKVVETIVEIQQISIRYTSLFKIPL